MNHISTAKIKNIFILTLFSLSFLFGKATSRDTLPLLHLVDQFDNKVQIKDNSILIISFQKSVSSKIHKYLASKPKDYLEKNNILYISDLSAAPKFMIKLFGIPKMKKFDYKVALIYDDFVADKIEREDDKVTIIKHKKDKIVDIQFVSPKDLNKVFSSGHSLK